MSLSDTADRIRLERAEVLARCPVARLRTNLPEPVRDELDALMRRPHTEMPTSVIIESLRAEKIDVSTIDDGAMQSHRRTLRGGHGCKCPA